MDRVNKLQGYTKRPHGRPCNLSLRSHGLVANDWNGAKCGMVVAVVTTAEESVGEIGTL